MKMKFPVGVTHYYDEAGVRHEVAAGSTLEVPALRVPEYLAAGYEKVEEVAPGPKVEAPADSEAPAQ